MNTEHLAYLIEVCRCGSVNKTAKNLYISQSHLSSIIKNIEAEIGYSIFIRGASGIVLTPEGEIFMKYAQNIIAETRNIKLVPSEFEENRNLSIVSAPATFISQCFFEFKRLTNDQLSQDTFIESGIKESIQLVVEHRCRIGFLVLFEQNLEKYTLLGNSYNLSLRVLKGGIPMVVLMSKKHPLAKKGKIYIADILEYPFARDVQIDYEDTLDAFRIIDKYNLLYISSRGTCMDAVRKGMYLSIGISIPENDSSIYQSVCRPVEDISDTMAVACIKSDNYNPSQRENDFINFLTKKLHLAYPQPSQSIKKV